MDTTTSIFRSARSFFAGTALSRVSGLFRDMAMAAVFGVSAEVAGFMLAYRWANLFRRVLGEGNLQAGFAPHFTALKERGEDFYRDTVYSFSLLLFALVALIEAVLYPFRQNGIVHLTMLMVPGLFFISLYGLNASLLQCKKKYFLPALAPVAFNAIWIAFALYSRSVETLAWGVTLAFAAQWALTLSPLRGKPHLFSPDFKALLKPLALGLVGIGAVQFNSALDPFFARLADPQGPAYLWYAIRIQQLPMALFGIALSGALLPPLARAEDPVRRLELLRSALKPAAALMLFCTFGIFCLGAPGVNLLYGHGDFSPAAVEQTVFCLWAYGLGLVPSVFVLLLSARFYAEKNYRLPTQASLFSVFANIFMNALFVFALDLGAISIALATSLSAFLNMAFLARGVFDKSFGKFFVKIFFKVAAAALVVFICGKVIFPQLPREVFSQMLHMLFLTSLYLLCFLNRRTYEYMGLLLSTKSEAGGTSPSR